MKLDIILVDLVVVAMVVVPYLLFIKLGWDETQKLKQKFLEEVKKAGLDPVEIDSWNQNMIGLDMTKQKLILVQRQKGDFRVDLMDLKRVRTCGIKIKNAEIVMHKKPETILQRIDLEFSVVDHEEAMLLNLFDHDTTYTQDYELKHAEKWHFLINKCLSFRPTIHTAA